MPPKDLLSLIKYLLDTGQVMALANNLLAQWGPAQKPLLGATFLPPRFVDKNDDVIQRVALRTVAAQDGTRHSPAQLVDGGELFGSIAYRLGHSDLARQFTGPDYDALVRYLNQNLGFQAASVLLGLINTAIVQAMAEHDELKIWEAIVSNSLTLRGDNGYFEYTNGVDLAGHRIPAGGDWSDPDYDPWIDVDAQAQLLVSKGFERNGIRMVTTDQSLRVLMSNPHTAQRAGRTIVVQNVSGSSITTVPTVVDTTDLATAFGTLKLQAPITYDRRILTKTGQVRAYPEGNFTLIASTGRTEEIVYNTNDPATVPLVIEDTLGFLGIGTPNGRNAPERAVAVNAYTNQKDAQIHAEGWQATGPVILEPEAVANISEIL